MKNWAGLVVALYFGALALLALPLRFLLVSGNSEGGWMDYLPWAWGLAALFAGAQALLLVVPTDLVRERPVARRKLLVPVLTSGLLLCLLMLAGLGSLLFAIAGDDSDKLIGTKLLALLPLPFLWCVWGWVFYLYLRTRDPQALISRLVKSLLRGSILELLVAVPSHVIVRHRNDCCAPLGTFAGIVTGLSVMLMSFGPGVLFLFARRFRDLRRAQAPGSQGAPSGTAERASRGDRE
jgi:hypothetical protein